LWIKKTEVIVDNEQSVFNSRNASGAAGFTNLDFHYDDNENSLLFSVNDAGGNACLLVTTAEYRDPSAWMHVVIAYDSTQEVAANRVKIYVNGEQVTSFSSETYPPEDKVLERWAVSGIPHNIGANPRTSNRAFYDGYLAEFHYIDGTAYDADDFGETGDYGEWKPKEVSSLTYGNNGFYLDFADSAALGDDESGEGNDWTVNNLDASDQMLDSPTNNFATLNPLRNYSPLGANDGISEGNLKVSDTTNWINRGATFGVSSGKWYWEIFCETCDANAAIGIVDTSTGGYTNNSSAIIDNQDGYGYCADGRKKGTGVAYTSYGDSYTTDDIISVALDMDAGTIKFYKNDAVQDSGTAAFTSITGTYEAWVEEGVTSGSPHSDFIFNFGQDSSFAGEETAQGNQDSNGIGDFYYTPPTDYLALCTSNLPDVAVIPSEHFDTILYDDGAGAKTGVGFQPDLVWLKSRGSDYEHELTDAVRGVTKAISADSINAESTDSTGLTVFGADGFTVGADTNYCDTTGDGMVSWNWKANGSGSANTVGSIDSTVSVNDDAGFSMAKYTRASGDGVASIGHGLSKAPDLIIAKRTNDEMSWYVYHSSLDSGYEMYLNDSSEALSGATIVAPSSTVINYSNLDPYTAIAYCWHSVDGYSKMGTYTGNGNANGSFVYTGFRPAFVLLKREDSQNNWGIYDTARDTYNLTHKSLYPDVANGENVSIWSTTENTIDILSNGFKMRTSNAGTNANGGTYIYLAFAETPFKYSNAR
jgi:hypothetical protein